MRGNRRDYNQQTVANALARLGVAVVDTSRVGGGFSDLVCAYRGRTYLVEVKNPDTAYGKKGPNKNQRNFIARWHDEVYFARTESEAEALVQHWSEQEKGE